MTDRELLEFAAKAAGMALGKIFVFTSSDKWVGWRDHHNTIRGWNPLTDDGDALRLAVKLRFVIHVWDDSDNVSAAKTLPDGDDPDDESDDWHVADAHSCGSLESAARRAIVRAAAEIGKAMP